MNEMQTKIVSLLSAVRDKGILSFSTSEDALEIHSGKKIVSAVFGENCVEVFSSATQKKILSGDFSLEKVFRLINEEISCSNINKVASEVSKAFPNLSCLLSATFYPVAIQDKSVYYQRGDRGMIFQHKEDPEISLGIFEELYKRNAEDQMLILDNFELSQGSAIPASQILNRKFSNFSLKSLISKIVPLVSEVDAMKLGYPNKVILSANVMNFMPDLDSYVDETIWKGFLDDWLFSCKKGNEIGKSLLTSALSASKWLAFSNEKLYSALAKIRSALSSVTGIQVGFDEDSEYSPLSSNFDSASMVMKVSYSKTTPRGDHYSIQTDGSLLTSAIASATDLRPAMSKAGISHLTPGTYTVLVSGKDRIERIQNNIYLDKLAWKDESSIAVVSSFKKIVKKGILLRSSTGVSKYTKIFQARSPKGVDFQIKSGVIDLSTMPESFIAGFNSRYDADQIKSGSTKRLVLNSIQLRDIPLNGNIQSELKSSKLFSASAGVVDPEAVDELVLFITNDGDLYRQRVQPMVKNLARKMKRGVYDPELAVKLWMYLADEGAKKYKEEFGTTFNRSTRLAVARELSLFYKEEIEYKLAEMSHKE